jgi:hypothetical protein
LSEELVMALWNKYMERVNRELLEEAWVKSCLFFYSKIYLNIYDRNHLKIGIEKNQ